MLSIPVRNALPNNPYTGRVLASRIKAPRTIDAFRRAVSLLESIKLSRIGDIMLDEESGVGLASDSRLPTLSDGTTGMSSDQPLLLMLSRVIDGVAEPCVVSAEEPRLLHLEMPEGWMRKQMATLMGPNAKDEGECH